MPHPASEEHHMTAEVSRIKFPLPALASPAGPEPEIYVLFREHPVTQADLPDGSRAWLVGGYDQVRQVLTDQRFSRALAAAPERARQGFELSATGGITAMDPPEHSRLRKLVASAFTARRVEALRPRVAAIVDQLIDGLAARPQPADLVTSLSLPLPVQVICEMLGVPATDMEKFRGWTGALVADWELDSGQIWTALTALHGYFAELIRIKRARPGDDLLSALIEARDSGDRLSEQELTLLGSTLLVAGYETTANHISLSVLALLEHPAELAGLRAEPGLIPAAVEELMRYVRLTGGAALARVTTEDTELGGVTIPAGEVVLPFLQAANRDSSAFSQPDRFDLGRAPASHLGFGAGVHHCLGAQLARVELQEALRGLVTRLPGLALGVPLGDLTFRPGMAIYNLRELPVTWTEALPALSQQ
jgi:cytochrome P450